MPHAQSSTGDVQAESSTHAESSNVGTHTPTGTDTSNGENRPREFVEFYPNEGAGAPIASVLDNDFDLAAYILACGPFADPKAFQAAELLISSNLTNAERTEFLQSEIVSQRANTVSCAYLLMPI